MGLILLTGYCSAAQPPDWENEQVLERAREPARATFWPYPSVDEAREGAPSPWVKSLNGQWRFHWSPTPDRKPRSFSAADFDDSDWDTLPIPSNWQLHGYGTPIYVSAGYPFRIDPPRVTSEPPGDWTAYQARNPVGAYRRRFTVPDDWTGQRVFLHFAGVEGAFYVWVNGQRVGYSQGSRSPAEFDVTDYVTPGENVLAVEVFRWSDGSYLEDQDMWRLSGVHRDVVLYAAPPARIRDFAVRTELDDDYRDATLIIEPELAAPADVDLEGWSVAAQLFDADGATVFDERLRHDAEPILNRGYRAGVLVERTPQRGPAAFGWLRGRVENPAKWTAETPHLYRLVVSLVDPSGDAVEAVACDVGFREIEVRDGRLLVSGAPIKLRGVNRHEHDPRTGHAVSYERMVEDIRLLKRANVNAVRTAHYPNDPRWYELCDRYGVYVVDEADLETHGLRGRLASEPRWAAAFLDRTVRLAERDKNHPSVVMWSLGNESGYGPNFAACAAWLKDFDPTRPIHYEGAQGQPTDPATVDVISRFYPRVLAPYLNPGISPGAARERAENARWERLAHIARDTRDDRPVLASEYAHAMGNAVGNLQAYWDEIYAHPRLLGGFIWDWCDQGLWAHERDGVVRPGPSSRHSDKTFIAYGGAFGDEPNSGAFCLNGVVMADRSLTPKYWEVKKVYQPIAVEPLTTAARDVTVRVRNRHHALNLSEYEARWRLEVDGHAAQSGEFPAINLPAGQSATVAIPVESISDQQEGAETWLRVSFHTTENTDWADAGHEVAFEQFRLDAPAERARPAASGAVGALRLAESDGEITITGDGFRAAFDRNAGTLRSLRYDGLETLHQTPAAAHGPVLQAYRAPTDNDRGFGDWLAEEWRDAGLGDMTRTVESLSVRRVDSQNIEVEVIARSNAAQGAFVHRAVWTVRGDGMIQLDNQFTPEGKLPPLPRIGVAMRLNAALDHVRWFGRGPHENYPDRRRSAAVGLWEGRVADQLVPYPRPQESGSKQDVRWVSVTDADGRGVRVTAADAPFAFSALSYTAGDLAAARRHVDLQPRAETILSLDARQCGLGNSSCGPGVLERYAVRPVPYALRFTIRPAGSGR